MQWAPVKKILVVSVLALAMLMTGPLPGRAAQEGPLAQIKGSVDAILSILNNKELAQPGKAKERQERIMAEVRKRFDFREMSKLTLARYWRRISEPERAHFVDLFAQLLKDTYIGRVESYSHKEVRVNFKDEEIHDDRALVDTTVIANSTSTPIEYRLKREDGKWMVYDVVIEGVSLVGNYRIQFAQIIQREKFAGLIQRIEAKVSSGKAS